VSIQASLRCHLCDFSQAGQRSGISRPSMMESNIILSVRSPVRTAVPSIGQRIIISGVPGPGTISPFKSRTTGTAKPPGEIVKRPCPCFAAWIGLYPSTADFCCTCSRQLLAQSDTTTALNHVRFAPESGRNPAELCGSDQPTLLVIGLRVVARKVESLCTERFIPCSLQAQVHDP
jgi:hypothetical protein